MVQPRKRILDADYDLDNTLDSSANFAKRKCPRSSTANAVIKINVLDLTSSNGGRGENERGPPAMQSLKKLHTQTQNGDNITLPKFKGSNITAIERQNSQTIDTRNDGPGNGFWDVKLPSLSELLAGTQQSGTQPETSGVPNILSSDVDNDTLELINQYGRDLHVSSL